MGTPVELEGEALVEEEALADALEKPRGVGAVHNSSVVRLQVSLSLDTHTQKKHAYTCSAISTLEKSIDGSLRDEVDSFGGRIFSHQN